jgi:hypothetical protein
MKIYTMKLIPASFLIVRHITNVIGYLFCSIPEMIACRCNSGHINTYRSFRYARSIYLLSRGLSEYIDSLIFGRRYWRSTSSSTPHASCSIKSLLRDLTVKGFTHLPDVCTDDLKKDLSKTRFRSRVNPIESNEYCDLLERMNIVGRWDAEQDSLYSYYTFAALVVSVLSNNYISQLLNSKFVVTSALVWASFPCNNLSESIDSAQVFHIDFDYLDDMKIFINLDLTVPESGPLEYISGTHRPLNKKIYRDDWICEETIFRLFNRSDHYFFTGDSGTVYLSDNRGIHRDSPPAIGFSKLAMQINLSRSHFGSEQMYGKGRINLLESWDSYPVWRRAIDSNPMMYRLLFK